MDKRVRSVVFCGVSALSALWATYAGAAITPHGALDLGHTSGTTYKVPYTANSASNLLEVLVQNGNGDNTTFGVTDNGVAMTLACGSTRANSGGMIYSFYLLGAVGGINNLVVTASAPVAMSVGAADYAGVGALEQPCKSTIATSPATITISTLTDGDFVMLATGGYTAHSAGAGDVLRAKDGSTGYQQWGLFDSGSGLPVGSHSFTTSLAIATNSINQLAMVFSPAPPPPPPPVVVPPPPPPPVSVSGTPFSFGWKGSNPDGQTLFTAPHTYTIGKVELHVTVPASASALLDVYKVANNVPCTAATGTKLHSGDFNAAGSANATQVLPLSLVAGAVSLAVDDSVCVVTTAPFTADGQATVTVTAQ